MAPIIRHLVATLGIGSDAAAAGDGTVIGIIKRMRALMGAGLPANLGPGGGIVVEGVAGGVAVIDTWSPGVTTDATADDSDKTFTVPADTIWQPLAVTVTLATTATVGNRQMTVDLLTDADVLLARVRAAATQEEDTTYTYTFAIGLDKDFAPIALHLCAPLSPLLLAAGYKIRVWDSAAIAAAADDMTVSVTVLERAA